jgi:hypothetical protein
MQRDAAHERRVGRVGRGREVSRRRRGAVRCGGRGRGKERGGGGRATAKRPHRVNVLDNVQPDGHLVDRSTEYVYVNTVFT